MGKQTLISIFIELRATGLSLEKISKQIGVSKPTLIKWSASCKVEIENLRAISQEHILNELLLSREDHIKRLASIYTKALDELEKRDLTLLSIEKLVKVISELRESLFPLLNNNLTVEKNVFDLKLNEYESVGI